MSSSLDIEHLPIKVVEGYWDSNNNHGKSTDSSDNDMQQRQQQPSQQERLVWKASVDECVCEPQTTYSYTVHESPLLAHGYTLYDVFIGEAYFDTRYRLYVTYHIVNYTRFIKSLYYFIASECLVFPREFETPERIRDETSTIMRGLANHQRHSSVATKITTTAAATINGIAHDDSELGEYDSLCEPILNLRKALLFDKRKGTLSRFLCPDKGALPFGDVDHTHSSSDQFVMFCSEPEIAAALYINVVTSGRERYRLLSTLKTWLAEVSVDSVAFVLHNSLGRECEQAMIVTELQPTFALHFLYADRYFLLNNTSPDCDSMIEQHDTRRIKRLAVYTVKNNDEFVESCKIYNIHSIRFSKDVNCSRSTSNRGSSNSTANSNNRQQQQQQQQHQNKDFTRLLVDYWRHEDVYSLRNRRDNRVLVMRKRQRSRSRSRSRSPTRRRSTSSSGTRSRSRSRSPSAGRATKRKVASFGFRAGKSRGSRRRSRSR